MLKLLKVLHLHNFHNKLIDFFMTEVASIGNFIMKESIKELNDLKESWKSSKLAVFNKMAGIFNQKRTICKKRDALLDLVLFVQFTKPETLLHSSMGASNVFWIVQMVPNPTMHHIRIQILFKENIKTLIKTLTVSISLKT